MGSSGYQGGYHYQQEEADKKTEDVDGTEPRLGVLVAQGKRDGAVVHIESGVVLAEELFAQAILLAHVEVETALVLVVVALIQHPVQRYVHEEVFRQLEHQHMQRQLNRGYVGADQLLLHFASYTLRLKCHLQLIDDLSFDDYCV